MDIIVKQCVKFPFGQICSSSSQPHMCLRSGAMECQNLECVLLCYSTLPDYQNAKTKELRSAMSHE